MCCCCVCPCAASDCVRVTVCCSQCQAMRQQWDAFKLKARAKEDALKADLRAEEATHGEQLRQATAAHQLGVERLGAQCVVLRDVVQAELRLREQQASELVSAACAVLRGVTGAGSEEGVCPEGGTVAGTGAGAAAASAAVIGFQELVLQLSTQTAPSKLHTGVRCAVCCVLRLCRATPAAR